MPRMQSVKPFNQKFKQGQKEDSPVPCQVEGGAVMGSNVALRSPPSRGLKGISVPFLGVLTAGTYEDRHPYP